MPGRRGDHPRRFSSSGESRRLQRLCPVRRPLPRAHERHPPLPRPETMNSLSEDVELYQSELSPEQLAALQIDLTELTEILATLPKGGSLEMAPNTTLPLDEGIAQLTCGAIHGLQIRYRYDGDEWWDTLLRTPRGVRLVRRKM